MEAGQSFTEICEVRKTADGFRFTFSCDLCRARYTVSGVQAETLGDAFTATQEDARYHFNCCRKCRRWVCDADYNEDTMMCKACSPQG